MTIHTSDDPFSSVSAEVARATLDRLIADPAFEASERNRRFLRFVAEETLAGRQARIKSYTVAVDVFGRNADFDPTIDPIVRIEATRLRSALNTYYEGPGAGECVQILMPKGAYVPQFVRRSETVVWPDAGNHAPSSPEAVQIVAQLAVPRADVAAAETATTGHEPGIGSVRLNRPFTKLIYATSLIAFLLVAGLSAIHMQEAATLTLPPAIILVSAPDPDGHPEVRQVAIGFTQSLEIALSRFDGMQTYELSGGVTLETALTKISGLGGPDRASYVLEAGVQQRSDAMRFWWTLKEAPTGRIIWADATDQSLAGGMQVNIEETVAARVAKVIGQPLGVVASRELERTDPVTSVGYRCVLRSQAYQVEVTEALHRDVRECLEATTNAMPRYANAWSMLALVYLDEDRDNFNRRSTVEDARQRALSAAQRAVALAPNSETAQESLFVVLFRLGHFDAAFAAGRRALEINPNNPELMANLGVRQFARGDWDTGAALVRKAVSLELVPQPLHWAILVLDPYRRGDYVGALEAVKQIDFPGYYVGPLLRAAVYGKLGNQSMARENLNELIAIRPQYAKEFRADMLDRHMTEPMIDMIRDGLVRAGLQID